MLINFNVLTDNLIPCITCMIYCVVERGIVFVFCSSVLLLHLLDRVFQSDVM